MKVLMVMTSDFHRSGITMVLLNYYKELIKNKNCEIDFVIPNKIDKDFRDDLNLKTKIFVLSKKMRIFLTPLYIYKLSKIMRKGNYDVVHINGSSSLLYLELLAAKNAKIKKRIAHSHSVKTEHPLLHKLLRKRFLKSYTHAIACSEEAGKWLFNDSKFEIINNGFDIEKFIFSKKNRKEIRNKLNIKDDDILLGHVGLFNDVKNQTFLINIMKRIVFKYPNYKLLLIGEGKMKNNIENQAIENRIQDNIIFYGETSTPEYFYSAMDIFVMPSKYEGLGLVALEAQICGLPCILSSFVPKKVKINDSVFFCNIDDSDFEKWCDLIININKNDRKILIQKFDDYDIKKCTEKLYNLYLD